MTQTATTTPATNGADKPKVNRRSFTERLTDLSLEEKVAVIKELKAQVVAELAKREQAAKEAGELTKGL